MITQTFKQGNHDIKIESADSLDDAKVNGFKDGVYSRFYVDGKPVADYMTMICFIVGEAKTNRNQLIPTDKDFIEARNTVLKKNTEIMREKLAEMRATYKKNGVAEFMLKPIDDMIGKLDTNGLRARE